MAPEGVGDRDGIFWGYKYSTSEINPFDTIWKINRNNLREDRYIAHIIDIYYSRAEDYIPGIFLDEESSDNEDYPFHISDPACYVINEKKVVSSIFHK